MASRGPPSVLAHLSETMAGVSAQTIKIDSSSARTGLKPSSSVSFSLPQNALVDLDTLAFHASVAVTNGRMPSAMSLIERFEISMGGQVISGGSSFFGVTQAILEANTGSRGDLVTEHGIVATAAKPYQAKHTVTADTAESCDVTFSNFKTGFLGTCGTRILNTARCPIISIRITWAPTKVLVKQAASGAATYEVNDIFATVSALTIANPAYAAMEEAVISAKGYMPLPFKEFTTIRSSNNGIVRSSISSRSVDRIHVAYQAQALDVQGAPIETLTPSEHTPIETLYAPCETFSPSGAYLVGADAAAEAALVAALDAEFYLELGGVRYPQMRATLSKEWPKINRDSLYDEEKNPLDAPCGRTQVRQKNVSLARLNLPGSNTACYSTGINSQSQSLIVQANCSSFTNAITYIVCEVTSLIMLNGQRELSLSR